MTSQPTAARPSQADLDVAMLLLSRLGISPGDLQQAAPGRPPAPMFAEYIPVVSEAVSTGTRRVYSSYWNRILKEWGGRRLDEPDPTQIKRLAEQIKTNVVPRRNARGGRSAAEHLIAALRCLYNHAVADGHLAEADNPARKVAKTAGKSLQDPGRFRVMLCSPVVDHGDRGWHVAVRVGWSVGAGQSACVSLIGQRGYLAIIRTQISVFRYRYVYGPKKVFLPVGGCRWRFVVVTSSVCFGCRGPFRFDPARGGLLVCAAGDWSCLDKERSSS